MSSTPNNFIFKYIFNSRLKDLHYKKPSRLSPLYLLGLISKTPIIECKQEGNSIVSLRNS